MDDGIVFPKFGKTLIYFKTFLVKPHFCIGFGERNECVNVIRFFPNELLKKRDLIALRYYKGEMSTYLDLPANPNGSIDDIAGLIDPSGKILGLMPHPERGMFFVQKPNWPVLKEQYKRLGKFPPSDASGLKIFQNAIKYFS